MQILATKRDVIWSYAGTFFRMGSSFLLLPFLLSKLSDEALGLWYVFQAVYSFVSLFQSGFVPTFARNVAYCCSGARELKKQGVAHTDKDDEIDYSLLTCIISASKSVYRIIALLIVAVLLTGGTAYVYLVADAMEPEAYIPAWFVFCGAVFLNMYFSYFESLLRGIGDFESTNIATIVSSIGQLTIAACMLLLEFGLISCAVAFCVQGVMFRFICCKRFFENPVINGQLPILDKKIRKEKVRDVIRAVAGNAFKDTLVSMAGYIVTTANTIICSIVLPLSTTGSYSVVLQLVNASATVAAVMLTAKQPTLQSAYARNDRELEKRTTALVLATYVLVYLVCTIGVSFVVVPVVLMIRSGFEWDWIMFFIMVLYIFLWRQHTMCAAFIANTNNLPYVRSFVISSFAGIALTTVLCSLPTIGVYGLVLGQAIAQLCYNNWKWPIAAAKRIDMTFFGLIQMGFQEIVLSLKAIMHGLLSANK